ncbi:MAG TPA: metal-sensitive transcriptional regulator [Myxococcota bacterium]|jgi:DNA-binding FrmR family transcriptional regulator|nr:metal-sensitive transcriptional regulator [Myxococcota bacterium]
MQPAAKEKLRARLRRIAGQVAGIERMIDEDRYCVEVLHQIAAVESALDRVGKLLLEHHVAHCVAEAFASGDKRARGTKMRELLDVVSRFARVARA